MNRLESDIVRAQRFEIVDDQGRVRAAIGPGPNGEAGAQIYGSDGAIRVELSVDDDSTVFTLRDPGSQDIVSLAVGQGTPSISLTHAAIAVAEGEADPDESWSIAMTGENPDEPDLQRCSLLLTQGRKPRLVLTLLGEDNEPCVLMRQREDLVRMVP